MKETVQSRQTTAKNNISLLINALSQQGVITNGLGVIILKELSKIEDNPYALFLDIENKEIITERAEKGKVITEKWILKREII